jgi:hypothetical protein
MGDDEIHDLTAAYALDALDAHERDGYEAHLAGCARCRAELGGLHETATALAHAAGGPQPPAALRARILEAARAERPNVVPLRPRWAVPAAVAAAVAACAALGFGLWSLSLARDLDRTRSAAGASREALALVARADARRVDLAGADGVVAVTPSGRAAVAFAQLPAPPSGKTYEAWVIRNGRPQPAGTFDGTTLVLTRALPAGSTLAVTIERDGGARQPTSAPFAQARV